MHLSDTHFGTEDSAVVDALLACLERFNSDLVVISGDITQRAYGKEFKAAREFIKNLPAKRIICVPGNHDIPLFNLPARFIRPFYNYQKYLCRDLQTVYNSDQLCVVALNTVMPYKHVDGRVSKLQIDWVTNQLKSAPASALKIVVAHHPFAVVLHDDKNNLINGANEAVDQWSRAGLDLILGGHIHFPFFAPLNTHFKGIEGDPWVVQTGTATSTRVRNNTPNAFVKLQFSAGRSSVCLQRWDYDSEREIFFEAHCQYPWGLG